MNSWQKKDHKYIWHPYTQMKDCEKLPPLVIEKARGIKLFDDKGNYYYDTISSWWCNLHGHAHPKINAAIKKQLKTLDHVLLAGVTHKPVIQLAEKLVAIAPKSLKKVFFSDNGSTAVESALKISFQYWQNVGKKKKQKFVALDLAYHGDTMGSMSVSGVDLFNKVFSPLFFKSFKVPTPHRKTSYLACLKALEKLLKTKHQEIAALILEPLVMGAAGMIMYPKEYLSSAAKLARKYNVHLILDEVATGFGRTGKMFACQHANVLPDIMCLSKGLTAGYLPMGATLVTDKIYQAFYSATDKHKTFYHGHTYTGNPLACAAALASLEVFRQEKVLSRVSKLLPFFHQELEKFRDLDVVADVRYLGLIGVLELKSNRALEIYQRGLKKHLLLRPLGNVVYFFFPLCINKSEIKQILESARQIFE